MESITPVVLMALQMVGMADSQFSSVLSPGLPPFGNCDPFVITEDALLFIPNLLRQEYHLRTGIIGQRNIAVIPQLESSRVICLSSGTREDKYSSVAILVTYRCSGAPCQADDSQNFHTLKHVFYLRCLFGSNTWALHEETGSYSRSLYAIYRGTQASVESFPPPMDGECALCFNVHEYDGNGIQFMGTTNFDRSCHECYSTCRTGLGSRRCISSAEDSLLSCCRWYMDGQCMYQCPEPLFTGNRTSFECQRRITLTRLSKSNVDFLCADHSITYQCSVFRYSSFVNIIWNISYPGQEHITVLFHEGSEAIEEIPQLQIRAERTILSDDFIESTLWIIVKRDVTFGYLNITCSYNELKPEDAVPINLTNIAYYVPLAPTHLRVIQENRMAAKTRIMLAWDPIVIPNELFRYDFIQLSATPRALSQKVEVTSPYWLDLNLETNYMINLTLANCAGANSTFMSLFTTPYPELTVTDSASGVNSSSDFNLVVSHGTYGPQLTCSVGSALMFTQTWYSMKGLLPSQIQRTDNTLKWERAVDFSDVGQYICNATNRRGTSSIVVNLTVTLLPTIASIYPNFPSIRRFDLDTYSVFAGYSGLVASCTAVGSPPPDLKWTRVGPGHGQTSLPPNTLSIVEHQFSMYRVAKLVFSRNFKASDSGTYSCTASASDSSQSKTIMLVLSRIHVYPYEITCSKSITDNEVAFRIRLLDTDCFGWDRGRKSEVIRHTLNILRSVVFSECDECLEAGLKTSSNIICNEKIASIVGSVDANSTTENKYIFCSLDIWQQKQPLIQVATNLYYHLDTSCSLGDTECEVQGGVITSALDLIPIVNLSDTILQYIAVLAGWMLVLFMFTMLSVIFAIQLYKSKKCKPEPLRQRTMMQRGSHVQRFSHGSSISVYPQRGPVDRVDRAYRETVQNVYPGTNFLMANPSNSLGVAMSDIQYSSMYDTSTQSQPQTPPAPQKKQSPRPRPSKANLAFAHLKFMMKAKGKRKASSITSGSILAMIEDNHDKRQSTQSSRADRDQHEKRRSVSSHASTRLKGRTEHQRHRHSSYGDRHMHHRPKESHGRSVGASHHDKSRHSKPVSASDKGKDTTADNRKDSKISAVTSDQSIKKSNRKDSKISAVTSDQSSEKSNRKDSKISAVTSDQSIEKSNRKDSKISAVTSDQSSEKSNCKDSKISAVTSDHSNVLKSSHNSASDSEEESETTSSSESKSDDDSDNDSDESSTKSSDSTEDTTD